VGGAEKKTDVRREFGNESGFLAEIGTYWGHQTGLVVQVWQVVRRGAP